MTGVGSLASSVEAMTSAEAAEVLGVSARQVQRLARSGQLVVRGTVGRAVLLEAGSVLRLATAGVARGRQWTAATVWTALALLTAGDSSPGAGDSASAEGWLAAAGLGRLDASRRWHLRARLRGMQAEELARMTRRRAELTRWRVSASYAEELRSRLALTATDAIAHDRDSAGRLGLAGGGQTPVDGYTTAAEVATLQRKFFLTRDVNGNATLRALPAGIELTAATGPSRARGSVAVAAPAVVALDLADSLDPRERAAGLRLLRGLLEHV